MACCAGDSVKGAIPAFKFGKPLKDNFHDGKVHPYIDSIMKYTITKKERIRHPSGVKAKELERLRKLMSKRSDGLDLKKEGITGAQGMAIIKEVLDELPTSLFGKAPANIAAWNKACKRISTQTSTTSWSQQELSEATKLFKQALSSMEPANYLMLKYLVAFIRVLSQHPDTQAVRPKQAQAMTKYYGTSLGGPKSKDDTGLNAKGLYFLVDNSDELYEPLMEEELFPLKNAKMSRASKLADESKVDKEPSAEMQEAPKTDGMELKDYSIIGAEDPDDPQKLLEGSLSLLGEQGYVKSKISGLEIDDPRLDGLDIWMYLVHNVEQQIAETKNTINSSSTTEVPV